MKGEFIIEYTGEIISYFTLKSRQKTYILKNQNYILTIASKFYVDATKKGNISRFT